MTEITALEKQEAAQGLENTGLVGDTCVIPRNEKVVTISCPYTLLF